MSVVCPLAEGSGLNPPLGSKFSALSSDIGNHCFLAFLRSWKLLLVPVVAYLALQLLVFRMNIFACSELSEPFSEWVMKFYLIAGVVFSVIAVQNMFAFLDISRKRWPQSKFDNAEEPKGCYLLISGAILNIIAAASCLLGSADAPYGYSRVCQDKFGVESVSALWAEWLVNTPFAALLLITRSAGDGIPLTLVNFLVMISSTTIAVTCVFVLNSRGIPTGSGVACIVFSCICSVLAVVTSRDSFGFTFQRWMSSRRFRFRFRLPFRIKPANLSLIDDDYVNTSNERFRDDSAELFGDTFLEPSSSLEESSVFECAKLAPQWLLVTFFSYYLTYWLRYTRAISRDQLATGYLLCTVLSRMIIFAYVTEMCRGDKQIRDSSKERELLRNETRDQLLRYVFHEVRVPLNTVSMGLSVVREDETQMPEMSREAITMMSSAVVYVGETMNDLLSMHAMESGSAQLNPAPFSVKALVEDAMRIEFSTLEAKLIVVDITFPDERYSGSRSVAQSADTGAGHAVNPSPSPGLGSGAFPAEYNEFLNGDRYRLQHALVTFLSYAIKHSSARANIEVIVRLQDAKPKSMRMHLLSGSARGTSEDGKSSSGQSNRSLLNSLINSALGGGESDVTPANPPPAVKKILTVVVSAPELSISPRAIRELFIPYGELRPESASGESGLRPKRDSGLGFALAKQHIELHGGKVIAFCSPVQGLSLGFRVPLGVLRHRDSVSVPAANGTPAPAARFSRTRGDSRPCSGPQVPRGSRGLALNLRDRCAGSGGASGIFYSEIASSRGLSLRVAMRLSREPSRCNSFRSAAGVSLRSEHRLLAPLLALHSDDEDNEEEEEEKGEDVGVDRRTAVKGKDEDEDEDEDNRYCVGGCEGVKVAPKGQQTRTAVPANVNVNVNVHKLQQSALSASTVLGQYALKAADLCTKGAKSSKRAVKDTLMVNTEGGVHASRSMSTAFPSPFTPVKPPGMTTSHDTKDGVHNATANKQKELSRCGQALDNFDEEKHPISDWDIPIQAYSVMSGSGQVPLLEMELKKSLLQLQTSMLLSAPAPVPAPAPAQTDSKGKAEEQILEYETSMTLGFERALSTDDKTIATLRKDLTPERQAVRARSSLLHASCSAVDPATATATATATAPALALSNVLTISSAPTAASKNSLVLVADGKSK
jgi:signal transduction histidine kinase